NDQRFRYMVEYGLEQQGLAIDLRLQARSGAQIVDDPGEVALPSNLKRPDSKVDRKDCSVLTLTFDLPADADDPFFAGRQVACEIAVMLSPIRLGHQHIDGLPQHLAGRVAEHPFRGRIYGLYAASTIDCQYCGDRRLEDRLQHG